MWPHTHTTYKVSSYKAVWEYISDTSSLALLWENKNQRFPLCHTAYRIVPNRYLTEFGSFAPLITVDIPLSVHLILKAKLMDTEFVCLCNSNNDFLLRCTCDFFKHNHLLGHSVHQNVSVQEPEGVVGLQSCLAAWRMCVCVCAWWVCVSVCVCVCVCVCANNHGDWSPQINYVCKMGYWNGTWTRNSAERTPQMVPTFTRWQIFQRPEYGFCEVVFSVSGMIDAFIVTFWLKYY